MSPSADPARSSTSRGPKHSPTHPTARVASVIGRYKRGIPPASTRSTPPPTHPQLVTHTELPPRLRPYFQLPYTEPLPSERHMPLAAPAAVLAWSASKTEETPPLPPQAPAGGKPSPARAAGRRQPALRHERLLRPGPPTTHRGGRTSGSPLGKRPLHGLRVARRRCALCRVQTRSRAATDPAPGRRADKPTRRPPMQPLPRLPTPRNRLAVLHALGRYVEGPGRRHPMPRTRAPCLAKARTCARSRESRGQNRLPRACAGAWARSVRGCFAAETASPSPPQAVVWHTREHPCLHVKIQRSRRKTLFRSLQARLRFEGTTQGRGRRGGTRYPCDGERGRPLHGCIHSNHKRGRVQKLGVRQLRSRLRPPPPGEPIIRHLDAHEAPSGWDTHGKGSLALTPTIHCYLPHLMSESTGTGREKRKRSTLHPPHLGRRGSPRSRCSRRRSRCHRPAAHACLGSHGKCSRSRRCTRSWGSCSSSGETGTYFAPSTPRGSGEHAVRRRDWPDYTRRGGAGEAYHEGGGDGGHVTGEHRVRAGVSFASHRPGYPLHHTRTNMSATQQRHQVKSCRTCERPIQISPRDRGPATC